MTADTESQTTISSPRASGMLGHLPALRRENMAFFERCAREHGDFVPLRLGPQRAVLLSHPDLVEEVFVERPRSFNRGPGVYRNGNLFGGGLLASQGEIWRRQRKLAQPAFHRERIAEYAAGMVECTEDMVAGWRSNETRLIHNDMTLLALRIIIRTVFGVEADRIWNAAGKDIADAMETLPEVLLRRMNGLLLFTPESFPAPTNMRLRKIVARLDSVIYPLITERRRQPSGTHRDLLSMLMEARDEDDNGSMSDREIRDELVTFLFAGHETTAAALAWTWYLLAKNPVCRRRLEAELDSVLAGKSPGIDHRPNLTYTEQVAYEAMRLYPPGWVLGREAQEDLTIGGHPIHKGSILLMSPWVIQRDQRFFDNPLDFIPERWTDGFAKRIPRFAYFPFGGGPRVCIGNMFALTEIVMVLATIANRFRLDLRDDTKVGIKAAVTLRPTGGMPMTVTQR